MLPGFAWGVSSSAPQTEGAWNAEGKGPSIWDHFSARPGNRSGTPAIACDFYNRYRNDIALLRDLGIPNFRFSLSWPRLFPKGTGYANRAGLDYYHRLIDACLENNITPWITLYHWDLPQALQERGGWVNRDITGWFAEYVTLCVKSFGDKVRHWMVLNEPMVFTGAGYYLGVHAPGKKGKTNF